jgi:Ala-tRNA(Pro) deacylase
MPTVAEHLRGKGLEFEVIPHAQAYTSVEEARALGISADEVLKSVAVKTASGYALAVVPGTRRLDMRRVRDAVGDHHARLATEEELERDFADFELGGLPPLGSLLGVSMYVDPEVMDHDVVVFAAGKQTESVRMRREDLLRAEPHTVAPLSRHPEEEEGEPAP